MLIAPLGANTLAKLSNGLCDNLLSLICRAWSFEKVAPKTDPNEHLLKYPIIVCPSMNILMWDHPITKTQLNILKHWGYDVVGPISKKMMCGDIGNGAMSEVKDIVEFLLDKFEVKRVDKINDNIYK